MVVKNIKRRNLKMRILILAIKYWWQGDDWKTAWKFAKKIVKGFK